MNHMKKLAAIAAVGAAMAISSAASAVSVDLTSTSSGWIGSFNDNVTGSFNEVATFTIPGAGTDSLFSLTSTAVTSDSIISGFKAYLDVDDAAHAFDVTQTILKPGKVVYTFGDLYLTSIDAGAHTIYFSGTTGAGGAGIGGSISIAAAAVPEPATWAMMIGGVGFAGGALRRRAKRDAGKLALA